MYKVIYKDESVFEGGNFENSKWNEINKPIKELIYTVGHTQIILKGYEKYNHLIERVHLVGRGTFISNIILMGCKNDIVQVIKLNIQKRIIEQYISYWNQEYNEKSTTGWKEGLKNQKCGFEIN